MNERRQDRLFAACGVASAVLVHVGLFVGLASGQAFVNLGSSPAKVAHELAKPDAQVLVLQPSRRGGVGCPERWPCTCRRCRRSRSRARHDILAHRPSW